MQFYSQELWVSLEEHQRGGQLKTFANLKKFWFFANILISVDDFRIQ